MWNICLNTRDEISRNSLTQNRIDLGFPLTHNEYFPSLFAVSKRIDSFHMRAVIITDYFSSSLNDSSIMHARYVRRDCAKQVHLKNIASDLENEL